LILRAGGFRGYFAVPPPGSGCWLFGLLVLSCLLLFVFVRGLFGFFVLLLFVFVRGLFRFLVDVSVLSRFIAHVFLGLLHVGVLRLLFVRFRAEG